MADTTVDLIVDGRTSGRLLAVVREDLVDDYVRRLVGAVRAVDPDAAVMVRRDGVLVAAGDLPGAAAYQQLLDRRTQETPGD